MFAVKWIISIVIFFVTTSCLYRMPEQDEISTLPKTNSPTLSKSTPRDIEITPHISY